MSGSIGRNDPCTCGSGKKYKRCCLPKYEDGTYMLEHVTEYPIRFCMAAESLEEEGLGPVIVVRTIPQTNKYIMTIFLCDIFCLGLKNVIHYSNCSENMVALHIESQPQELIHVSYEYARGVVLGSIDYAHSLGFVPYPEWDSVKNMVEYARSYESPVEFGKDGRPLYIRGPYDNAESIVKTLEKKVGGGKFDFDLVEGYDSEDL